MPKTHPATPTQNTTRAAARRYRRAAWLADNPTNDRAWPTPAAQHAREKAQARAARRSWSRAVARQHGEVMAALMAMR